MKRIACIMLMVAMRLVAVGQVPQWFWATRAVGGEYDRSEHVMGDDQGNVFFSGSEYVTMSFGNISLPPLTSGRNGYIAGLNWQGTYQWVVAANQPFNALTHIASGVRYSSFGRGVFTILDTSITLSSLALVIGDLSEGGQRGTTKVINGLLDFGYDANSLHSVLWPDGASYLYGTFADSLKVMDTLLYSGFGSALFLAKLDDSDQLEWVRVLADSTVIHPSDLIVDPNGDLDLAGDYQGVTTFGDTILGIDGWPQVFLAHLDSLGEYIRVFSSSDFEFAQDASICRDASGNTYLTRSRYAGSFATDVMVTRFGSSGDIMWDTLVHFGNDYNASFGIVALEDGGVATGIENFTYGPGVKVVALDTSGSVLWTAADGPAGQNWGSDLYRDANGSFYLCGVYELGSIFGLTVLPYDWAFDVFVTKLSSLPLSVGNHSDSAQLLSVYPNPTNNLLHIRCEHCGNSTVLVCNALGNLVVSEPMRNGLITLDMSNVAVGLYMIRAGDNLARFVKE